jgi:hypothetical protein
LALAAQASSANAAPDADACLSSYEQTQRLRKAGKLVAAEEQAIVCASEACPAALRGDCITWLDEIRRLVPSVVFSVKGDDGCGLADANVLVDGSPRASRLDGRPIAVDPGEHLFRVELPSGRALEERVLITSGDQAHRVELSFAPPGASCSPKPPALGPEKRGTSVLTYAVAGAGLTALLVGVGFEASGLSQQSTLSDCRPRCEPSKVDDMRRTYLVGDVLVAGGAAVLGLAVYLWLSERGARKSVSGAGWVGAMPGGGGARLP